MKKGEIMALTTYFVLLALTFVGVGLFADGSAWAVVIVFGLLVVGAIIGARHDSKRDPTGHS